MNEKFDIKRFWLFLKRELTRAYNDMGLTILILGIAPLILFGIVQIFCYIIAGTALPVPYLGIIAYVIALGISTIIMPIKLYGPLTDKRFGSEWLMVPASRLEKYVTLILITCVISPLAITAITFATDGLLNLFFPETYSAFITKYLNFEDLIDVFLGAGWVDQADLDGVSKAHMSIGGVTILNTLEYTVFFLLGAVLFNKSKFGKTVLCLIALSTLTSMISTIATVAFNFDGIIEGMDTINPQKLLDTTFAIAYVLHAVVILLPMYFIWLRVKTLKH